MDSDVTFPKHGPCVSQNDASLSIESTAICRYPTHAPRQTSLGAKNVKCPFFETLDNIIVVRVNE